MTFISPVHLEPLSHRHADALETLAADPDVALKTRSIPHPYPKGGARPWVDRDEAARAAGTALTFAIVTRSGETVGAVTVSRVRSQSREAEIGYFIGKAHWNRGYATAAVALVLPVVFSRWEVDAVEAKALASNGASARVLENAGFEYVGAVSEPLRDARRLEDQVHYRIRRPVAERTQIQSANRKPNPTRSTGRL